MKPDEVVYSTLTGTGLAGTRDAWPMGGAPALPWFTYKRAKGGEVFADDTNFTRMCRYDVSLYEREQDDTLRETFEAALDRLGPNKCHESWLTSENCWVTSYSLTFHPDK